MSKTTGILLVILVLVIGVLLFVVYGVKQNPIITSLNQPAPVSPLSANTSLSFALNGQSVQPRQTVTAAIILTNANPHPTLTQFEIAYDPTVLTIDSLMPGAFFTNPTIALQNIDPETGRISYALRCPTSATTNEIRDCADPTSPTVALLTFTVNSFTSKTTTMLSFLPKTVIRTRNGRDILQKMTMLHLPITRALYPISSSSAVASIGAIYNH